MEPRTEWVPVIPPEEQPVWDIFFCSVVAMQYHPANPPKTRMSLEEAALVADTMLEVRRCRLSPQR